MRTLILLTVALCLAAAPSHKRKSQFPPTPSGFDKEVERLLSTNVIEVRKACDDIVKLGESGRPMVPWLVWMTFHSPYPRDEAAAKTLKQLGHTAIDAVPELTSGFWAMGKVTAKERAAIAEDIKFEAALLGSATQRPINRLGNGGSVRIAVLEAIVTIDPEHSLPLVVKVMHLAEPNDEAPSSMYFCCIRMLGEIGSDDDLAIKALDRADKIMHGKNEQTFKAREQIELKSRRRANQAQTAQRPGQAHQD